MSTEKFNNAFASDWSKQMTNANARIFLMVGMTVNGEFALVKGEQVSTEQLSIELKRLLACIEERELILTLKK